MIQHTGGQQAEWAWIVDGGWIENLSLEGLFSSILHSPYLGGKDPRKYQLRISWVDCIPTVQSSNNKSFVFRFGVIPSIFC